MNKHVLLLIIVGVLVGCGGGKADNQAQRTPFYTPTPAPSLTPQTAVQAQPTPLALINNFSRADGALRVQYPDGWFVETEGEAATGALLMGSSRAALRGNLTREGEIALRIEWSPTVDLVEATIARDADPLTLLTAIVAERPDELFTPPVLLAQPKAARADSLSQPNAIHTVLLTVDFGAGVSALLTFKVMGDLEAAEPLITALVDATRYGGPPAISADEDFLLPALTLDHNGTWVRGGMWSADGSQILTWADDGLVRLWDMASGEVVRTFFHPVKVQQVLWFADETRLLVLPEGQALHLWDVESGQQLLTFDPIGTLQSFSLAPNEQMVMGVIRNFAAGNSNATIWNLATGEVEVTIRPGIRGSVEGAVWSHDSTRVIVYGLEPRADVWDVARREVVFSTTHSAEVTGAVWRGDDAQLITLSRDSMAHVWDLESPTPILSLTHTTAFPRGALWNSDYSQILTWQADRVGRIWDMATGEIVSVFENRPALGGAVWNADETRLLSWSVDRVPSPIVHIWDLATGEALVSLVEQRIIDGQAWQGDFIVSWDDTGVISVWDTRQSQTPVAQMRHTGLQGALWDSSATLVLSWSRDGTVRVWAIPR